MQSLNKIGRYKQKFAIALLYKGKPKLNAEIKAVNEEWEEFTPGVGDAIKRISTGEENISFFLYKAPKGFKFPPHYHKPQIESGCVISGKIRITAVIGTSIQKWEIHRGESFSFPNNEHHYFEFLEDSEISLLFFPKFTNNQWKGKQK